MPDQRCRAGALPGAAGLDGSRGLRPGGCRRSPIPRLGAARRFGSLRWGEPAALRRSDIDVQAPTVRVVRQLTEQRGGGLVFRAARVRGWSAHRGDTRVDRVAPRRASGDLRPAGDDGVVFTSPQGTLLRHSNFLSSGMAASTNEGGRSSSGPFPRSAPFRKSACR
jgi:hypothetical protein